MKPFLPILLLVLSVGMFYLYTNPRYAAIRDLLKQRSEYQTALANIEAVKQLRDSLETQYGNLSQDDINRLEKIIPQNLNTVKLSADLDAIASRRSLSLKSVRVNEQVSDNSGVAAKEDKPYKTTTISFTVLGSYPNFVAMLKDMEKSLQLIDVRSISMRSGLSSAAIMQFDVTFQTYWIQ